MSNGSDKRREVPTGELAVGFGHRLKVARIYLSLTQAGFSAKIGSGQSVITRLERGVSFSISIRLLHAVCTLLETQGLSSTWLMLGTGPMQLPDPPVKP